MNITIDDPRLTAYVLNELDADEHQAVEKALEQSPECRREAAEVAQTATMLGAELAAEALPDGIAAQQMAVIGKARQFAARPTVFSGKPGLLIVLTVALMIGFGWWLDNTVRDVLLDKWSLCVPLIALIALYLVWIKRGNWMAGSRLFWERAAVATMVGVPFFAFPLTLLTAVVPLPASLNATINHFFDQAVAAVASAMFQLAGTNMARSGLRFVNPSFSFEIARICFVPPSTLMLFVVSMLGGYYFLRSLWKRAALTSSVIVLAIVERGINIFAIAEFGIHYGFRFSVPDPILIALLLVPVFLLLVVLRRSETMLDRK